MPDPLRAHPAPDGRPPLPDGDQVPQPPPDPDPGDEPLTRAEIIYLAVWLAAVLTAAVLVAAR